MVSYVHLFFFRFLNVLPPSLPPFPPYLLPCLPPSSTLRHPHTHTHTHTITYISLSSTITSHLHPHSSFYTHTLTCQSTFTSLHFLHFSHHSSPPVLLLFLSLLFLSRLAYLSPSLYSSYFYFQNNLPPLFFIYFSLRHFLSCLAPSLHVCINVFHLQTHCMCVCVLQAFEGVVIARRNRGLNSSFTVRKMFKIAKQLKQERR